jgi:HK97 family phage portal protein
MKLLGFEITRESKDLQQVSGYRGGTFGGGWWPIIREPWTGAWQRNRECTQENITAYHAVFACITLIASDISKLRVKFIRFKNDVWQEDKSAAFDPVLRKPNHYQTRIQFWESWILSKLQWGNTYVLKERDQRGIVTGLYVLDPCRVRSLVSTEGAVFYEINVDNLSNISNSTSVPASEIIHDRMNCFYHPLCGIAPLYAAGLAASQGLTIQQESIRFFSNRAVPGGVLTAPGRISEQSVAHLKAQWENNFSGANQGKIAVLGDGLKFDPMAVTAQDAQLLEQLKATAEWVCSVFHVPPYKVGVGPLPSYNNVQALNTEYYSQCLQTYIEAAEVALDEGLSMGPSIGVEFDLDGLLRMDTASQISSLKEATLSGILAPNESRAKLGYPGVKGGDSPYLQQQNYSLAALDRRDTETPPPATPAPPSGGNNAEQQNEQQQRRIAAHADKIRRLARRYAA